MNKNIFLIIKKSYLYPQNKKSQKIGFYSFIYLGSKLIFKIKVP